jgi:hypothetical protein
MSARQLRPTGERDQVARARGSIGVDGRKTNKVGAGDQGLDAALHWREEYTLQRLDCWCKASSVRVEYTAKHPKIREQGPSVTHPETRQNEKQCGTFRSSVLWEDRDRESTIQAGHRGNGFNPAGIVGAPSGCSEKIRPLIIRVVRRGLLYATRNCDAASARPGLHTSNNLSAVVPQTHPCTDAKIMGRNITRAIPRERILLRRRAMRMLRKVAGLLVLGLFAFAKAPRIFGYQLR